MWHWAISSVGKAVATWLSAILSVVAIVIALTVALVEQRRSHAEHDASSSESDTIKKLG